jgi:RNA polymerase sigma factor (sigma-70 family)
MARRLGAEGKDRRMSSKEGPKLAAELDRVYLDNARRLQQIGGKAHPQDAADIVQEAVARTLEAGQRHAIRDPLRFLFKVTRNVVLTRLREKDRHPSSPLHEQDPLDTGIGPEQAAVVSERLQQAMAIIERMPERRREAFMLHRINELTYAEVAGRMDISIKAVEKHISAAMSQLYAELDSLAGT